MHLPPSDASSASRLAFCTASHHSPAFRLSSHSITWLLGPPPSSCNTPPLRALSRHTAAPSGCTVASSRRRKGNPLQPLSGLPTSRAASTLATPCPLLHATPPLLRYTAAASIPTFFPHSATLVHHVTHALHIFSDLGLISIISAVLYISLHQQVDPYPFLFGFPARCTSCLVYFSYNKLNTLDSLLVSRSAPLHLPMFRSAFCPKGSCPYRYPRVTRATP